MAHKKGVGSSRNGRTSNPQYLGVKRYGGEKVVAGKGRIVVFVGPLRPGRYPYFGEFHMDTAKGTLIAE